MLILTSLVFRAAALTDKEILQLLLNGVFEENKLPDSTTIVPCIDDDSAHKIVVFIGVVLEKAARGSLNDLISLPQLIKDFGKEIPQQVNDCLDGNAEVDALQTKYNPNNESGSVIQKRAIEYVTLHYLSVHKEFGKLNDEWKKGSHYQTGFDMAAFAHLVVKLSQEDNLIRELVSDSKVGSILAMKLARATPEEAARITHLLRNQNQN